MGRMRYRTVIFDCDSTLSALEGIDELAGPHRAEVARLTELAMAGEIALEEIYGRRLAFLRPTRAQVEALGRRYIEAVVPDAAETVGALQRAGVVVQVVSGGLLLPVLTLARHLGIPDTRVAAVPIWFDAAGEYAGFDVTSPFAQSGGKRRWIESNLHRLPRPILLVGDGATDLETRPVVDTFAAFTGVARRAPVVAEAEVELRGPSLLDVLRFVEPRGGQEPPQSASAPGHQGAEPKRP